MMPYKVVTKHTYSSKTKLGMSPFQYLRDKLDTTKSRKVGIAHPAPSHSTSKSSSSSSKKKAAVISKDLSKENSTETKRTEKTTLSEGTDPSTTQKPTQPASHLYHSSHQKYVGGSSSSSQQRPASSSTASRKTISHNYSRTQYRMGVSNRTPSSQKRSHARPTSASTTRGNLDDRGRGVTDRLVYSRPSSASGVRSSSSKGSSSHSNYYQQTYHQVHDATTNWQQQQQQKQHYQKKEEKKEIKPSTTISSSRMR